MEKMENRIGWVDYAKSLTMFMVILLHMHCDPWVTKFMNAVVMPSFFTLSGFLFSYRRNQAFGPFASKRFRQLVVPYLWIGLLAYLCWVLVLRNFGSNTSDDAAWWLPLVGHLAGIPPCLTHDVPLWSLLCFFVVEIIFYPVFRRKWGKWVIPIASLTLSWGLSACIPQWYEYFPLALAPAIIAIFFYWLGHMWALYDRQGKVVFSWPVLVGSAIIFPIMVVVNGEYIFYTCHFGDFPLFVLGSVSGVLLLVNIVKWTAKLGDVPLIRFISRTTLIICGFHLLVFAALKGAMLYGLSINPDELTAGPWRGLLTALLVLLLTLPVCYIIEKRFRFLVDK